MAEPVKAILADPMHPLHDEVANTIIDVQQGTLRMCACMGPQHGEPFCPCEMTRRGLPPSPARVQANETSARQLAALVRAGLFVAHH